MIVLGSMNKFHAEARRRGDAERMHLKTPRLRASA
jgi:hypothetical protein